MFACFLMAISHMVLGNRAQAAAFVEDVLCLLIDKEDILKALLEEFVDQIISGISNYYKNEKDLCIRR